MGEKLVIGPINKGIKTDRTAFNIDNDSFPVLQNAYQWRGRVKRKRGTYQLGRLTVDFNSGSNTITLDANGNGNLLTDFMLGIPPGQTYSNGNIIPGVSITDTVLSVAYTDPAMDGTLSPSGSINYGTGQITISDSATDTVTAIFNYYPNLPVMGLETFAPSPMATTSTLSFDTDYAYNITSQVPADIYNINFYKNPSMSSYLTNYVPKSVATPLYWNGQDYQQFWTTNYQGALWVTNGVTNPFSITNIGMQFKFMASIAYASANTVTVTITETSATLIVGDFVFINEVMGTNNNTVNFQTGYVTSSSNNGTTTTLTVELPYASVSNQTYSGGIIQYLTSNLANPTLDCLRWYDGDPTPVNSPYGWVNFMPPISYASFSIGDTPPAQYYLVGAKLIYVFKDRILFLGAVIQSSSGTPIYLQDAIVYSQNGTPYYTASFDGSNNGVLSAKTTFNPILTPLNQSATANSYFSDVIGFGGYIEAGIPQYINSVAPNEDVLLVGFSSFQTRLVYTGNDLLPFNFFIINSELGVTSSFSVITLDRGALTIGDHGIELTTQTEAQRIDVEIPDQVFEISMANNGSFRVTAQRDFINEWIYFTYPYSQVPYKYPNQTLLYNYRDDSWGIFNECYTTYGQYRQSTGFTWATVGEEFPSWAQWTQPWNYGSFNLLQPEVACGNQQGFVLVRDKGTAEGYSLEINNISFDATITAATQATACVLTANNTFTIGQSLTISGVVGMTQLNGNTYPITAVTPTSITLGVNSTGFGMYVSGGIATPFEPIYSPNHCLNNGDYIVINSCTGTIGDILNGNIFQVENASTNGFSVGLDLTVPYTYFGGGTIQRMYIPVIQTKQFPTAWNLGRKTRIGTQQYLLTSTPNGQATLYIFLSQNSASPYNLGPIVPDENSSNDALIYSTILYTSPEQYTQACNNLPLGVIGNGSITVFSFNYFSIFNFSNSLISGSTYISVGNVATFTDNGIGGFTVTGTGDTVGSTINYYTGQIVIAFTSAPTSQVTYTNFKYYTVNLQTPTAPAQAQIWHRINTSLIGDTVQFAITLSGDQMTDPTFSNQFEEIELHTAIWDIQGSQYLS